MVNTYYQKIKENLQKEKNVKDIKIYLKKKKKKSVSIIVIEIRIFLKIPHFFKVVWKLRIPKANFNI